MKIINYKILIATCLVVIATIVACNKDFLNKPPQGTLNPATMSGEAGIQGLLIGAYSLVDGEGASGDGFASGASNWTYNVTGDDAYKGSDPSDVGDVIGFETWTVSPTNGAIPQKWGVCYAGAQRCNETLNTLALNTEIDATKRSQIMGQARFLRAYFHLELKLVYGNIIYADTTVNPSNTGVSNTTDVWPKIEADLQFAINNLPETWSDAGRANKSAAKAMLAKALMHQKKYSAASSILKDLIDNGKTAKGEKYALNTNYFSNFNPAQKNSQESVFAAQTSVKDGSSVDWGGDPNGNYGDILNFPYNGGPGGCCGFYNPSQDFANAFKTDAAGLPLLDTWFNGLSVSDPAGAYTGTLDPRIDWAMGRKGIPYLDWGPHPGDDWIRNVIADGHFSPKKNVYAKSQKDAFTDQGSAYWGPSQLVANNVNIIRVAQLYLWYAECQADAGNLTEALKYTNLVRARAANASGWVYKNSDYNAATATYATQTTPADNYLINQYPSFASKDAAIKAIRMEERLELGMEGHRFFDLVRWGIAATTLNAYNSREKLLRPYRASAVFTAGKNEIYPIPQATIDNMNQDGTVRLKQNPGY
jgi:starch-binding outer membrane protein, SusD/RagB family